MIFLSEYDGDDALDHIMVQNETINFDILGKGRIEVEEIFDNQCKICGNELVLGQCNACQEKLNSLTGTESQKGPNLLGDAGEVLEEGLEALGDLATDGLEALGDVLSGILD